MTDVAPYIVFVVAIALIAALAWKHWPRTNYSQIPKKIWSYWDNPNAIPYPIRLCWESWRKHQPDYEIVILTKDTFKGYVTLPEHVLTHASFDPQSQRFVDALKVQTLVEHGGVWLDSSVLLQQPLDHWIFPKYAEFQGFYRAAHTKPHLPPAPAPAPAIQTWFLACNKGSTFLKAWRDEFLDLVQYHTAEQYVTARKKAIDVDYLRDPIESASEVALQTVLQHTKYPLDSLLLTKAEDGALKYLLTAKGDSQTGLELACQTPAASRTPLLKIMDITDPDWERKWSTDRCGWLD